VAGSWLVIKNIPHPAAPRSYTYKSIKLIGLVGETDDVTQITLYRGTQILFSTEFTGPAVSSILSLANFADAPPTPEWEDFYLLIRAPLERGNTPIQLCELTVMAEKFQGQSSNVALGQSVTGPGAASFPAITDGILGTSANACPTTASEFGGW
jgi:hypothetical protein